VSSMLKIVIIVDRQTSLPFRGIGIDVIIGEKSEELRGILRKLFDEEKYGIILITQSLAIKCLGLIEELSEKKPFPLITFVPDFTGEVSRVAEQRLKNLIRKAVGIELPDSS